jgi:hypothetical protein
MSQIPSRLAAACLLAGGAVLVSACSVPQVAKMSKDVSRDATPKPSAPSSSATSATSAKTPPRIGAADGSPSTAAPTSLSGDLQTGTLTHRLPAGERQLVISYWTTSNPRSVSQSSPMTLQLAAHLEGGDGRTAVKVTRFHATLDDGSTPSTVSDDRGEFVLTQPFSYSTAMNLRPSVAHATLVTVTAEFDLLIETSPGTGAFYRQTVLDTLHVAFQSAVRAAGSSE